MLKKKKPPFIDLFKLQWNRFPLCLPPLQDKAQTAGSLILLSVNLLINFPEPNSKRFNQTMGEFHEVSLLRQTWLDENITGQKDPDGR